MPGIAAAAAVAVGGVGHASSRAATAAARQQRVGPALLDAERVEHPVRRGRHSRRIGRQQQPGERPGRRLAEVAASGAR